MTDSPQPLSSGQQIDFTSSTTLTFSNTQNPNPSRNDVNGTKTLWSGNVLQDYKIKYVGSDNDRDPILIKIGGSTPTAISTGYFVEDVNMDGTVKYIGSENDRDPILVNIGGSIPTLTLYEQLPE